MNGVGLVTSLMSRRLVPLVLGGAGSAMPADVLEVTRASEPPQCVRVILHL
jgi:uncharacterized protein (DUF697 family)